MIPSAPRAPARRDPERSVRSSGSPPGPRSSGRLRVGFRRTPAGTVPLVTDLVLPSLADLDPAGSFAPRHIGPRPDETAQMLAVVGYDSLDALVDATVPEDVRDRTPLAVPPAADEVAVLAQLRERAEANEVYTSMIGLGYYGTV